MSEKSIQQQVYTRERGGIFHTTAGYDTIAISEDLTKTFVKKYLHPICIYSPPIALTQRGEKNSSLYPEALTIIQPETGELIIGQAVFVPADFTGQRSSYFMHNYVIPQEHKEEWLRNPAKLFQMNDFKTSYDIGLGQVLSEPIDLSFAENDLLANKDELLLELGVTESIFKQLLFAIMSSIAGKKKVYISLKAELQNYTKVARKLLELLFHYLPYSFREKLGALTFSSEPEGKKYIHVTFFEPGTLNLRNRSLENQFIFDFFNQRIYGVELLADQGHHYLDFAWKNLMAGENLDDFFAFAERALSGFAEEEKIEMARYYELTAIYQMLSEGDTHFFQKNKIAFLTSLVKFLQINVVEKKDLEHLFIGLLQEEKVAEESASAIDFIRVVLLFNQISLTADGFSFILNTLKHYKDDPLFDSLWKIIEDDKHTYQPLVELINEHPDYEDLLDSYLDRKFKPLRLVEEILEVLSQLLVTTPYLLKNKQFKTQMIIKTADAVGDALNPFKAANLVKLYEVPGEVVEFASFKEQLMVFVEIALLDGMNLNNITLEDIEAFGRLSAGKITERELKEAGILPKYRIMNVLHDVFSSPTLPVEMSLKSLPVESRSFLREILKHLLQGQLSPMYFQHLLAAFNDEEGSYHFNQLFTYLRKYADTDEQTALMFIQWTAKNIRMDSSYNQSLKNYLKSPKSIWKNKAIRKELLKVQSYSFKKLIKEVQNETSSPIARFFRK